MSDMAPASRPDTWLKHRQAALLVAWLLLAGAVVSVFVAWGIAFVQVVPTRALASFTAVEADQNCSVNIVGRYGMQRAILTRATGLQWGPLRATGAPDTHQMGDIATAWASESPDGHDEWLELDYARPIVPRIVRVFETNAPGALSRVTVFDSTNTEIEVWRGTDPAKPNQTGVCVADIPVTPRVPTSRVRLYLDSMRVAGWNEIDAVGLIDGDGNVSWANNARASSTYPARGNPRPMSFAELDRLLPAWVDHRAAAASTTFDAYGWPMLAMSMKLDTATAGNPLALPMRPVWIGLLVNAIVYGSLLWITYLLSFKLRRFVRESLWLRRGCCMQCGYDLRFDLARGCPECGWRRQ